MSIEHVKTEIDGFIKGTSPAVLCLRGPWGVGKTYTWRGLVDEHAAKRTNGLKRYALVSLFGVNSLDALKAAIFESSVPLEGAAPQPDETTVADLFNKAEKHGRPLIKFMEGLPVLRTLVPSGITSMLSFLSVRNMIICFDDLERRGKGLDLADVLGLASLLKEQRGCRVVLLLNEDKLDAEKPVFDRYLEKVVDVSLKFSPTVDEAVAIASSGETAIEASTADICRLLGLQNIRIMHKIDVNLRKLRQLLSRYDPEVFERMKLSMALFSWSHLDPDAAPSMTFVRAYNRYIPNEKMTTEELGWVAVLEALRFSHADEADLDLMRAAVDGFFDVEALHRHADGYAAAIEAERQDGSFEKAWDLYHDSFDEDEDDVLSAIEASFRRSFKRISPTNLNGTIKLFKELGRPEKAKELLDLYVQGRDDEASFWNLDEYMFEENVSEPEVREAFAEKLYAIPDERDFRSALEGLRNGFNEEDLVMLAAVPVDEYYKMFKEAKGPQLRRLLAGAFTFAKVVNPSPPMTAIMGRAKEALKKIGSESPINARRVAKYGIAVPKKNPAEGSGSIS
ncbi:hypothetical protein SAMN06295905_1596 [Devosia lucknowensis]|uniref:KAP family P-loop domain-containing protein n=1 Tax=Devosia lucknowensis TaxID=1096929 RepID=A0A1Y6F8A8_9HYPH|nr:hypothetical protein [Devosia lucknowensis]SMQ68593.1 hypothetical protein SAMN06295905_1596 [Devosia lucknowensis]